MTDYAPMKLEKHYTFWIVRRWHIVPTSLPLEQAAKTNMVSVVRIQVFSILFTVVEGVANTCI